MKQEITHSTTVMTLAGKINQEQLKIGTGSGSAVGIYFDVGLEGKPGIRFAKGSAPGVMVSGSTVAAGLFVLEDESTTGANRVYVNGSYFLFYFPNGSYGGGWIISNTRTPISGATALISQFFYASTTDTSSNPWDSNLTWSKGTGGSSSPIPTFAEVTASKARWEYSTDGIVWQEIGGGGLAFEPIEFTADDLSNGILTIKHNLNNQFPLGVDYSVTPKTINYKDANTLEFDYSDQPSGGVDTSIVVVASTSTVNIVGEYHLVDGMDLTAPESLPTGVAIWQLTDTIWLELSLLVAGRYSWKIRANGNLAMESGSFLSADGWKWPWDPSFNWSGSITPIPTVSAKESAGFAGGAVWFAGSTQSMLTATE